jgi:hypothetical protein
MAITTCMTNSFRQELLSAAHCFMASQSGLAGAGANGAFTITGLASTANLVVGMARERHERRFGRGHRLDRLGDTGHGLEGSHRRRDERHDRVYADTFNIVLIKSAAHDLRQDVHQSRHARHERGLDLEHRHRRAGRFRDLRGRRLGPLGQRQPERDLNVALTNWTTNPSWTGATLSVIGCAIGNQSGARLGSTTKRSVSLHDFGGTQAVTAGTMTLTLPTADNVTAILRIA